MATKKSTQSTGSTQTGDAAETGAQQAQTTTDPQLAFPASSAAAVYSDLPVEMRYHPQDGLYYIGVLVNGAFIPISASKAGHIEDELREAATPGYKAARLREYQLEHLGLN